MRLLFFLWGVMVMAVASAQHVSLTDSIVHEADSLLISVDSTMVENDSLPPLEAMDSYVQQIRFNGCPLVFDRYYSAYMAIVPHRVLQGEDMMVDLQYDLIHEREGFQLVIKGSEFTESDSICFKGIDAKERYIMSLFRNDTLLSSVHLLFTCMPIVELVGEFSPTYGQGSITVHEQGKRPELLHARVRHRGATAQTFAKKAYAVKLYDKNMNAVDRSFFGLRSDNNWILDAAAVDPSRMRNRLSTDLWNDFSTKPYYYNEEPDMINGTRGEFVEVILNGEYQGLYCMTEKIDRKQLKLKKYSESTQHIRGVLYKSVDWTYETSMGWEPTMHPPSSYNNLNDEWAGWEAKYPDLEDEQRIDWKPLYDAVRMVATTNEQPFTEGVLTSFDMPTFMDYFLFIELLAARDNHGKNMYLYSYNINASSMLSVAPWDLDGTWGRDWYGLPLEYDDYQEATHTVQKRVEFYDVNSYNTILSNRYLQLRESYFQEDSLVGRVARYAELFTLSGAEMREQVRWQGTDSEMYNVRDEFLFTSNWIRNRLVHLDDKYQLNDKGGVELPSIIVTCNKEGMWIMASQATRVSIYTPEGRLLRNLSAPLGITRVGRLPKGLYLVNGLKVVFK